VTGDGTPPARRRYRSPLREQLAGQTRTAVITVATELFRDKGWAATGMRDVARAAGVAVETVYANFGSKSELLTACVDLAVVGDDDPVPLAERPAFAVLGRGTRAQRIRAGARLVAEVQHRTAGVLLALREAAASDPEMARWRREAEARRRHDAGQAAALIAGRPVSREEGDAIWAVTAAEVYELLCELRGWTRQQYERWLAKMIERLLPDHGRAS
jgi:AcrR family transcriptional regulator